MRRAFIAVVTGLLLLTGTTHAQEEWRWTMAFWNVENLFDTWHDTLKDDCAFTPEGDNHWTSKRYQDKQNKIFKTIAAMQPQHSAAQAGLRLCAFRVARPARHRLCIAIPQRAL